MTDSFRVRRFSSDDHKIWEHFVCEAKNSHFMHFRKFLSYHEDRFSDHSIMVEDKDGRLVGIMPAAIVNNQFISHPGLSFGGLLVKKNIRFTDYFHIFNTVCCYIESISGIEGIKIKVIPEIYNTQMANEIIYCALQNGFGISQIDLGSAVDYSKPYRLQSRRRRATNKAANSGVIIKSSSRINDFWKFLTINLKERHGVNPVHNIKEITKLKNYFPDNISLHVAELDNEIVAGVIIFETRNVAHTQYISVGDIGRKIGALDLLLNTLLDQFGKTKEFFSFGISTEQGGSKVNFGLLEQKEGFGAVTIPHFHLEK